MGRTRRSFPRSLGSPSRTPEYREVWHNHVTVTGDLPDRVRQAIPVAVVIHALQLLAPFDREALRRYSCALYYSDAQNPVDTGGRRPSPRDEPATAVLPAVLTESKVGFQIEEDGSVIATRALPNNLIVAAVWMAWVDAQKIHGETVPPLADSVWVLLCSAVAAHREGVSLRRPHAKWTRELKRSWDPRGLINLASTTDHHKAGWLSWCQRAAVALKWRESTTVGAYEKAVRELVRTAPK